MLRHAPWSAPRWRGVLVLNYHRIGDPAASPWNPNLYSATSEAFDAHLQALSAHADVLTPDELDRERLDRPGRRVLLTFDDGYRDSYELAYPVLRRHDMRAIFFVVSDYIDQDTTAWWDELTWMVRHATATRIPAGPGLDAEVDLGEDPAAAAETLVQRYRHLPSHQTDLFLDHVGRSTGSGRHRSGGGHWLSWDMVRELRDAGMGIGGHTAHHPVLARLSPDEQREEVLGGQARLEQELGEPMRWFAYPVGSRDAFTTETRQIVRATGVELAFSFYGGLAEPTADWPTDVRRVHVGPQTTSTGLRAMIWAPRLFARTS